MSNYILSELKRLESRINALDQPYQPVEPDGYECCTTCCHRAFKAGNTIRCNVWTDDVRSELIYKNEDPKHLVGRLHANLRCQYYARPK